LPAPQDAWRLYVEHWNACKACKNVDGGACEESTRLYLSWQGIAGDALRDVSTGRRGRY
jgi:translation initiation factor 2 beta subunit (eIF-2beta)/eIF-5